MKSQHSYLFLLPLGLSISKVWLAVIVLSFTDSVGDLFLAIGMKRVGAVSRLNLPHIGTLLRQVLTNPQIWSGILCQTIAFILSVSLLSWADVSFVRPASALTYIGSILGAKFILKEKIDKMRLIGINLIALGIAIHH
jgi:drug/metabolite transporter (DMT)-like permease